MNPLQDVTMNSVNLIDDRLRQLLLETEEIEREYGNLQEEYKKEPEMVFVAEKTRYFDLPPIEEEVNKVVLKPQITEAYTRTLTHTPDPFSLYSLQTHEPTFLNETKTLSQPPKLTHNSQLLLTSLDNILTNLT